MSLSFSSPSTSRVVTNFKTSSNTQSISFLIRRRGLGGGNLGRVVSKWTGNATDEEFLIYCDSGTSEIRFQFARVTQNDIVRIPGSTAANIWIHVGFDYDTSNASAAMLCNAWFNGANVSAAFVQSGVGAYNINSDAIIIGNRTDLIRNFDGDIAEVGIWNRRLAAEEWAQLGNPSAFLSPSRLSNGLTMHVDLIGGVANDKFTGSCTIFGCAPKDHPPIRR